MEGTMFKTTLKKSISISILIFVFIMLTMSCVKQKSEDTREVHMENGLWYEVVNEGTGVGATTGNTVVVHYIGTFQDGSKFDSSVDRGQPFEFRLGAGMVIRGWDIGVEGMQVGEKRILHIPADLAYGERGAGGVIPPNTDLIFEVELLGIK